MFAKNGMSKVRTTLVVAGVALGSSAVAAAQASDRSAAQAHAATAQQQADSARMKAAELAKAGGWAYKTGLVQRAEADAARYQAEADMAMAEASGCGQPAAPSPEQAVALERLAELRQAGGWAYKTGAVARAERDVEAFAAPAPTSICAAAGRPDAPRLVTSRK